MLPLALGACTPSNDLMPLRGEDPEALALSGERADWVSRSGATRSFERFRAALQSDDDEEALRWLGPTTRAALALRAHQSGISIAALLRGGRVEGLSLPGSEDPIGDLRRMPDAGPVREEGPFDPARTAVTLVVPRGDGQNPILVPAVHTDDGWRMELVRSFPESSDTASEPQLVSPSHPSQEEK